MKFSFGSKSEIAISGCHPFLQEIARKTLSHGIMDFAIIEGYRPDRLQHEYFIAGKSKVDAGNQMAKHNQRPALAFDAMPYINGKGSWNQLHCCVLAGIILATAKMSGYELRWGGDWNQDGEPITDQDFQDLVHFELNN